VSAAPAPGHDPGDPRLRFRLWIDGHLEDEVWIDADAPGAAELADSAQERHLTLAQEAAAFGWPYLVEIYNPAEPPDRAYIRFGTDRAGMVDPLALEDAPREVRDLFLPGDAPP